MMVLLVFASLACQALNFGGDSQESNEVNAPFSSSDENIDKPDTDYPMTADAYNVLDVGDGSILYYTRLSSEVVMEFYRTEYTSRGYTENELLTDVSDGVFSMVFDWLPSRSVPSEKMPCM